METQDNAPTKAKVAAFEPLDLATLDTTALMGEGVEIEMKHPTTKRPTGVCITIIGKHSEEFREIVAERQDEAIRKRAAAELNGEEPEIPTSAVLRKNSTDLLVACTKGWRTVSRDAEGNIVAEVPFIRLGSEDMEFNHVNARKLYERIVWIREQVDKGIGDLSLFIPA